MKWGLGPLSRAERVTIVFVLSLVSFISLVAATAAVTSFVYQDRLMPRTFVAGEPLGSQKQAAARQKLATIAASAQSQPITTTVDGHSQALTAEQLGVVVNEQQLDSSLFGQPVLWDWLRFGYWNNFFKTKHYALPFQVDEAQLNNVAASQLTAPSLARDAQLALVGGVWTVTPAETGRTIDIGPLQAALVEVMTYGQPATAALGYAPQEPVVSTAAAERTKTAIETNLQPVSLTYEEQIFSLTQADLYGAVDITKDNTTLAWQISDAKLNDLLTKQVAKKINLKMVPKAVKSDTGEVVTEGRDGKEVQVATLVETVKKAALAGSIATVAVPIRTIAFSQKIIYPDFVAGLFPGRYIAVNLKQQKLYLIENDIKVGEYQVSTGKWNTPTPKGTLYIKNKIPMAYSKPFRLWMPFWSGLAENPDGSGYKGYGLHDLPCFTKDCSRREGLSHLGTPVSHGCIRVGGNAAQLVYDWAPVGTPVDIR